SRVPINPNAICSQGIVVGIANGGLAGTSLPNNFSAVLGPTIPSAFNPCFAWNALIAAIVCRPGIPSIGPGSNPAAFSATCMSRVFIRHLRDQRTKYNENRAAQWSNCRVAPHHSWQRLHLRLPPDAQAAGTSCISAGTECRRTTCTAADGGRIDRRPMPKQCQCDYSRLHREGPLCGGHQ